MSVRLGTLTEIADAIRSTDVAQERMNEINNYAEAKKNEVLESIPDEYKKLSDTVDEMENDLSGLFASKHIDINADEVTTNCYINSSGGTNVASGYSTSGFVPVHDDCEINLGGIFTSTKASVCAYNENGEFMPPALFTNTETNSDTSVKIKTPVGCKSIRFSWVTKNVASVKAEYDKKPIIYDAVKKYKGEFDSFGARLDSFVSKDSLFDGENLNISSWEDSKYVSKVSGKVTNDTSNKYAVATLSVMPTFRLYLENVSLYGNVSTCGYDSEGNYIATLATNESVETAGDVVSVYIDIPSNVYIIKLTARIIREDIVSAKYVESPLKQISNVVEMLNDKVGRNEIDTVKKRFGTPISDLGLKLGTTPMMTIIDDDASSVEAITKIKNICDEYGIKITFAGIGNNIENVSGVKETLLAFQSQGFHVACHSYSHNYYWKIEHESFNLASIEADLIHALVYMRENGFVNYDMLVSPFNTYFTTNFMKTVGKYIQCAVDAGGKSLLNDFTNLTRYELRRTRFIGAGYDISYYTDAIDQAIEKGAWVILGTHSGSATEWNETQVRSVIEYAKTKGIDIVTLNEGWRKRKPLYDIADLLS